MTIVKPSKGKAAQKSSPSQNRSAAGKAELLGEPKCKRTVSERKEALENDPWACNVQENSVGCRGCGKELVMDKRFSFYTGFWEKHKKRCKVMKTYATPPGNPIILISKKAWMKAKAKAERGELVETKSQAVEEKRSHAAPVHCPSLKEREADAVDALLMLSRQQV